MGLIDKLKGVLAGPKKTVADQLIDEVVYRSEFYGDVDLRKFQTGCALLERSPEEQGEVAAALIDSLKAYRPEIQYGEGDMKRWVKVAGCLKGLLPRQLPLSDSDLLALVEWLDRFPAINWWAPFGEAARALEHFAKTQKPSATLAEAARSLSQRFVTESGDADNRKFGRKTAKAIGLEAEIGIASGEVWSDQAIADLQSVPEEQIAAWSQLLAHCQTASAGKPSGKWLKTANALIGEVIPLEQFREFLLKWFPLVGKPAPESRQHVYYGQTWNMNPHQLREQNQDILKGLVWCCSLHHEPEFVRALGSLGVCVFKKLLQATRLGNACIYALGALGGPDALAQLAMLKAKIKGRATQNQIAKALQAAAEREGVTPDEIEEMSVPEYGLTGVGIIEEPMGDFTARLTITGTSSTELVWVKPDGKTQKSVPAAVKADCADELKELRANAKDIQKMLPAIRERIDGAYLRQKSWPFATWKARFLDHPLVGSLARRLIWSFGRDEDLRTGIFQEDGEFVDAHGNSIDLPADDDAEALVRLWHPLDSATEDVLAWRNWLEAHLVQQPFKQAHREIYVLTEAEENTGTYSNRYAAHILKQHQFNALCLARGWKNTLRLMVDDTYPPATRYLPEWKLRAEFWIEGIGGNYGTDTNDAGTYLYLVSDQVRFYPADAAQMTVHASGGGYGPRWRGGNDNPLSVSEIPKLVFSEIMRDVDLFVGVSSVGNDPNWSDGGPGGTHRDYWYSYSFGDLSETARTRKAILERLLPRLKIAGQARIDGKFLVVEGKIRSYKIHLGSGNILMAPDDQYLCIVRNAADRRRGAGKLFLPFEGDNIMAIVLSKAFLLASDDKIKDRTILSQIRRKG